jgi:uncharacterized protein (DUF433 family)
MPKEKPDAARNGGRWAVSNSSVLKGVIHGNVIELEREPGLPDGQLVTVAIQCIEPMPAAPGPEEIPRVESWTERLVFDSTSSPGERIVKGTCLKAEALVAELEQGRTDQQLLQAHPELSASDVQAIRNYALAPVELRRSFGAWGEDAEELDSFMERNRERRRLRRRELDP